MMRRTKGVQVHRSAGTVPKELLDAGHQVWRNPVLFGAWCLAHDLPASDVRGWFFAYSYGRDQWALRNGFTKRANVNGGAKIDHQRLKAAGLPWVGSLTRAMARAEFTSDDPEAFREACQLAPYGPLPDPYPTWIR